MKASILRDSEFPEFEVIKNKIRSNFLSDPNEIMIEVAQTRETIYKKYMYPLFDNFDIAILDRSYYTSAVWQSSSEEQMYHIIALNESKNIPKADKTLVIHTPINVIRERLIGRNRPDLLEHKISEIELEQQKYLQIAQTQEECISFLNIGNPKDLGKKIYDLLM